MPTGVISDLHGDHAAFMGVLELIGAVDAAGRKQPGWKLIQIGDLVHGLGEPKPEAPQPIQQEFLRRQAADLRCAEKVIELCDEVLVGNHEFIFFGGPGFDRGDIRGTTPTAHTMRDLYRAGCFQAATSVGDWLITHAGLQPTYWDEYDPFKLRASELATKLNDDFAASLASGIELPFDAKPMVFWSLGARFTGPFRMPPGGIFWADWGELTRSYAERWMDGAPDGALKQIVGHTPQDGPRKTSHYPLVNIDVGAGLSGRAAAAVTHDDGATWSTHVYSR